MTLVEILVVLLVMALLAALAIPNINRLLDAGRVKGERDLILNAVAALPLEAYLEGREINLEQGEKILHLPAGWRVTASPLIPYRSNGLCGAGELLLTRPDGEHERYAVKPPQCVPVLL